MSTGTEGIVFNRLFEPGTHWDNWVKYPFYPGYCMIGEVIELGAGVGSLKVGDRVALRYGHASEHVAAVEHCMPVPADAAPDQAAWFGLAKIAAMGARAADHRLGERVVIIGAGPIGQMATRWANLTGPETLTVIDPVAMRLELARAGGATHVLAQSIDQALDAVRQINGGEQPDLVIDSTGHAKVFAAALAMPKRFGRLLLLGDTGTPSNQHLTSDVIIRGVRISGAHDGHADATWSEPRVVRLFFRFLTAGRFNMNGLNLHTFAPAQCADAYRFATEQRSATMGIVFKWS
jgi:2-desacetyl-2-hydroxyethyl bacteriochlorophyllide A dehydrogenase